MLDFQSGYRVASTQLAISYTQLVHQRLTDFLNQLAKLPHDVESAGCNLHLPAFPFDDAVIRSETCLARTTMCAREDETTFNLSLSMSGSRIKPESSLLGAVSHGWLGRTCLACSMWCAKVDEIAFVELVCRSGGASPLYFFEFQLHGSGLKQETRGTYRLLLLWSSDLASRRFGAYVFRTHDCD
jgi:hypothetical protein